LIRREHKEQRNIEKRNYKTFNILRLFILIISLAPIVTFGQFDRSLYNDYYKALYGGDSKMVEEVLIKINNQEKDVFFFNIKKAELMMSMNFLDSASIYYDEAIRARKYSVGYFSINDSEETISDVYQTALDNYNRIVLVDSLNAVHLCNRGILNQELGNFAAAIIDFNLSIQIEEHYLTYYNRAICFSNQGNKNQAVIDYTLCIKLQPTYGSAYLNRGFCYIWLKEYDRAVEDFEASLKYSKSMKEQSFSLNNLAFVYYKMKKIDKAIINVNLSIDINNQNSYAYKNRALINIERGNIDSVCKDLYKSLELGFRDVYGSEVDELIENYCN
jgi:tetratricopeptide (TPR) repeat protein